MGHVKEKELELECSPIFVSMKAMGYFASNLISCRCTKVSGFLGPLMHAWSEKNVIVVLELHSANY